MGRGPVRHRVFIEDARRDGTYLRATWHDDANQFVVSTWRDDVCTGAVRVPATEAAPLIGLLADGLADAASAVPAPSTPSTAAEVLAVPDLGPLRRLIAWLRARVPGPRQPRSVDGAPPAPVESIDSARRSA